MKTCLVAAAVLSTLALTACAPPPYKARPGEATALINVEHVPNPSICTSTGKRFSLVPDKAHEAKIPAGDRLTLLSYIQMAGYNVTWSCMPAIGFKPEAGKAYYGTVETSNQKCRYEVYRAGADNRVGLDLEETITRAYCPSQD
jgi:hypothetical protein